MGGWMVLMGVGFYFLGCKVSCPLTQSWERCSWVPVESKAGSVSRDSLLCYSQSRFSPFTHCVESTWLWAIWVNGGECALCIRSPKIARGLRTKGQENKRPLFGSLDIQVSHPCHGYAYSGQLPVLRCDWQTGKHFPRSLRPFWTFI